MHTYWFHLNDLPMCMYIDIKRLKTKDKHYFDDFQPISLIDIERRVVIWTINMQRMVLYLILFISVAFIWNAAWGNEAFQGSENDAPLHEVLKRSVESADGAHDIHKR